MRKIKSKLYKAVTKISQNQNTTILITEFGDSGKATAIEALAKIN